MGQEDVIARRYARGLAEQAADTGDFPRIRADVALLVGVLDPGAAATYVPEFALFLDSPSISAGDKAAGAERIAEKLGLGKTTTAFLAVLVRHGRAGLMPRIARAFADFAGDMTGERTAVVHTARLLTADQEERLARALSAAAGGPVHLRQQVEPGLLAGAKVTVGGVIYDGTVLGRLESLKNQLITKGIGALTTPDGAAKAPDKSA